jgi:hypothetical protein
MTTFSWRMLRAEVRALVGVGRDVGGVVFALCTLLSALRYCPCTTCLCVDRGAHVDDVGGLFGAIFVRRVGLDVPRPRRALQARHLLHPRPGEWPLFSAPVVGWGTTGALHNFANTVFLVHWRGTAMVNLYFRGIGVKLGKRVMPGCVVEELGVLGAGSIMKKDARVEANSIHGGIPARFIRLRGDKDTQDDGVVKS